MAAPLFCYDNILRTATVLSEDTITNFGFSNALDGGTSTQVGMAIGSNRDIVVDLGSTKAFDYFCVAGHNLNGTTITIAGSSDNVSYSDIDSVVFSNNYVSVNNISSGNVRYVRFRFSGMAGSIYIADIFLGTALSLPYGLPHGFVPPEQGDQDIIETNMTGGGALVGISVTRKPKKTSINLQEYSSSWFETYWFDLIETMKVYPIYFLWKEGKRALFCTLERTPAQPAFTSNILQSTKLDLQGFVE